ncbi:uncharacterized protein LOC141717274 [Apium graveolens]|uniref:uncharacterized protein LOC141717274 n=1 Tax=Apium graveolens TaxID=4045 RepID=UPI003D7B8CC9
MDLDTLYANAFAEDTEAMAVLRKRADRLSKDDMTILHIESMCGNAERVRLILTKFAQKNLLVMVDAFQQTALHLAADHGHTEVVEILIKEAKLLVNDRHNALSSFEAFVRQPNNNTNTALHLAVSNGHMDVAKLLVEADRGDRHNKNHNDETPVYLAAKLGYYDIVKVICKACTAPSLDGPHGTTALHPVILELQQSKVRR